MHRWLSHHDYNYKGNYEIFRWLILLLLICTHLSPSISPTAIAAPKYDPVCSPLMLRMGPRNLSKRATFITGWHNELIAQTTISHRRPHHSFELISSRHSSSDIVDAITIEISTGQWIAYVSIVQSSTTGSIGAFHVRNDVDVLRENATYKNDQLVHRKSKRHHEQNPHHANTRTRVHPYTAYRTPKIKLAAI